MSTLIKTLSDAERGNREPVFIFGSNKAGRHGKGAALWARQNRGAIYGQGEGHQGNSYAIPTKDEQLRTLSVAEISESVQRFVTFVANHPELEFQLTPIGCGLAGHSRSSIEPLFLPLKGRLIWPPEWAQEQSNGS